MLAAIPVDEPSVVRKYQSGFSECASEVNHYLSEMDGLDIGIRTRLLDHLANCVQNSESNLSDNVPKPWNPISKTENGPGSPIHIAPKIAVEPDENNNAMNCQPTHGHVANTTTIKQTNTNNMANIFGGIQVIPTKLPNGQIAFMLPGNVIPVYQSQQPQLDVQPTGFAQTNNNINNHNLQQTDSPINCQSPILVSPIPSTSSSEIKLPTNTTPPMSPIGIVTSSPAPSSVCSAHDPTLSSPHTIMSQVSVSAYTTPQLVLPHSPQSYNKITHSHKDSTPQDLSHRNAMQEIHRVHKQYLPHNEPHDVEMVDINNINKGSLPDHQDMWRPW